MAAPPVPPRPFDDYDGPRRSTDSSPPAVPPLPPDFKPDQYSSGPHYEDPLVAPRPHKLQPDLPKNMARTLDEEASAPTFQPPPAVNPSAFPEPTFNVSYTSSQPAPQPPTSHQAPLGFAPPQSHPISRGPSPLPPPQGSDWSPWSPPPSQPPLGFPQPFAGPPPTQQHQRNLSASFANLSMNPRVSSPRSSPPAPSAARDGPPSLTAPLPTVAILSVQQTAVQQPSTDPARKIAWCKDVLALVDRAQQLLARNSSNSADPAVGPAHIDDPELQKLVNVAVPIILQVSSQAPAGPLPSHVAEAIYMRATCAATGIYPQFIPHDPRTAFRDFERAAKAGYHAAWFKLGREYENFGDVQHAKDCFERGMKHGVESCYYRLGMAHLMGQLGFQPDPQAALPLLNRAATLATVEVPQPAYVYGLLLLNEFSHVSIPPHLFQPFLPPGATPAEEARRHLERAAYLNFAPAQYKLGHAYEFATPPFPFDALLSVQYYSLASQQGEIEADMALSKWFLCGAEGAFDKDENLAWTFAEKAARKGLPSAEFALGYYSEVGVGGPKNIEVARKWYTRAAQHGNADATERLQALSQPTPQALSREQHETLTDAKLVRKRTQAKQRSEAVGGATAAPIPVAQRSQIVNNIRKNSVIAGPGPGAAAGYGAAGAAGSAAAGYGGAPVSSSPPSMGVPARLPPADDHLNGPRRASGPTGVPPAMAGAPHPQSHPGSPRLPPNSPPVNGPQRQFQGAHRYSLVDPGAGTGAAQSPRPVYPQQPAGTPPLRRPPGGTGSPAPPQGAAEPPAHRHKPSKGPQTFEEMGIATQRAEDNSNCVLM
ncbi:HCP-like protein [Trametes cingulata]|nr:HCP-like protein [Trametes cingulata]